MRKRMVCSTHGGRAGLVVVLVYEPMKGGDTMSADTMVLLLLIALIQGIINMASE